MSEEEDTHSEVGSQSVDIREKLFTALEVSFTEQLRGEEDIDDDCLKSLVDLFRSDPLASEIVVILLPEKIEEKEDSDD